MHGAAIIANTIEPLAAAYALSQNAQKPQNPGSVCSAISATGRAGSATGRCANPPRPPTSQAEVGSRRRLIRARRALGLPHCWCAWKGTAPFPQISQMPQILSPRFDSTSAKSVSSAEKVARVICGICGKVESSSAGDLARLLRKLLNLLAARLCVVARHGFKEFVPAALRVHSNLQGGLVASRDFLRE